MGDELFKFIVRTCSDTGVVFFIKLMVVDMGVSFACIGKLFVFDIVWLGSLYSFVGLNEVKLLAVK